MDQSAQLPDIHLLRENADLLGGVEGGVIAFEFACRAEGNAGGTYDASLTTGKLLGRLLQQPTVVMKGELSFSRRADLTPAQVQPVIDDFVQQITEWAAETFRLEPPAPSQ